ncbi:MAG: HyaD/HybD family hydrogenase maturation endopeptidase [Deltaproteobacteria bacterium]|nr:HyaD/HybD family hydrogenase maturation endopeptidase [Deltaproteobacteria bacterium]
MAKAKKDKRYLVLGVGNILLKDEGLGVRAIEYIRERYSVPESVSVVDGGTGGLNLLSLIRDFDHIIIVDAVAPRTTPGALYRIPGKMLPKSPPLMTTAHQLGVSDMLAIADLEGYDPDVVVIGMEPKEISVSLELSSVIREKLPEVAEMVAKELEGFGVVLRERSGRA